MLTKKYLLAVILVTVATLAAGWLLWNSEKHQELDPYEAWSRGPEGAPVAIHAFIDFT